MARVARYGDASDHGGVIIGGSPVSSADGRPIARVGDPHSCPIHGVTPMVSGSAIDWTDGRPTCRIGDAAACGARIKTGSPTTWAD